jgi:hypothetical protein
MSCASSKAPSGIIHRPRIGRKLRRPPIMRRIPAEMRTHRDEGPLSPRKRPEGDSGALLRADRIDDRISHNPCRPRPTPAAQIALFTNRPTRTELAAYSPPLHAIRADCFLRAVLTWTAKRRCRSSGPARTTGRRAHRWCNVRQAPTSSTRVQHGDASVRERQRPG